MQLAGQINAITKLGAEMNIEIFGLSLVGAGAYLGAGLSVETISDDTTGNIDGMLDIKLYGILEIWVSIVGHRLNIVKSYPTILHKEQANTPGFIILSEDLFTFPGRAGGYIMREPNPSDPDKKLQPAVDIPYRIKVTDKSGNTKGQYPSSTGWNYTNSAGEFFQGDGISTLNGGNGIPNLRTDDRIYLVFSDKEYEYYLGVPIFPFSSVTITEADYFNDYVVGNVDPMQVKNWRIPPDRAAEERLKMTYPPPNTIVYITPEMEWLEVRQTGGIHQGH